jgi:predicted HicB family RNase H-like nuclease
MNDSTIVEGFASRCQKVLQVARELHARKPDWVTFFRETLGVNGAARSVFPNQEDYVQFEQSREFTEIQQLVATLRTRKTSSGKNEATRVITVRLPESLHESLKAEAADHNTSMNKLCISKLLQALIEEEEAQKLAQSRRAANVSPTTAPSPTMPATGASPSPQSGYAPQPTHSPQPARDNSSGFRSTYGQ